MGRKQVITVITLLVALFPAVAQAHSGNERLGGWSLDLPVLFGLVLADLLYSLGWARQRRASRERNPAWRAIGFRAGLIVLALALVSPIDAYGDELLAMHMAQHLLLTIIAPPLLVLGAPLLPMLWGLPRPLRLGVGRLLSRRSPLRWALGWLAHPVSAWVLSAGVLWAWHLPGLYEAALASERMHIAEHLSFFLTAVLFWWHVCYPLPGRRPLSYGLTLVYVFTAMLQSSLLGALMTLARRPWYPSYEAARGVPVALAGTAAPENLFFCGPDHTWGLSPLDDQQLAGLLMWVPGGLVYVGAMLALLAVWMHQPSALRK
jgi:cytochrome c oxidase assembly factor CtaG